MASVQARQAPNVGIILCRMQAVSNSLWAYARLSYNPGSRLLDVTAHRAAGMLHQYTSQEISNTLWALSMLEHHPGTVLLDAAAVQIARRVEQFSPQVSGCLLRHEPLWTSQWACTRLLASGRRRGDKCMLARAFVRNRMRVCPQSFSACMASLMRYLPTRPSLL